MAFYSWFQSFFAHRQSSQHQPTRRLRIENLEERKLLSATSVFTQDLTSHTAEFTLEPTAPLGNSKGVRNLFDGNWKLG